MSNAQGTPGGTSGHETVESVLPDAEVRRLEPLAAAIRAARQPGPPRLHVVAGDLDLGTCALGTGAAGGSGPVPRIGLLAGTFNPLTVAHTALAEAAAAATAGCDRVILAMAPTSIGKEGLERAHPLDRLDWVATWARGRPWAVAAVASHPLLVDMAEAAGRGGARVALIVGADKAAQLVDPVYYDDPEVALERLARAASLLVAERAGHPAPALPFPSVPLPTPDWVRARSSTQARGAAAAGRGLAGHVPDDVRDAVERSRAFDADEGAYAVRATALTRLLEGGCGGNVKDPRAARGGQDDARGPHLS